MLAAQLTAQINRELAFEPTDDQRKALLEFASFMTEGGPRAAMILRGAAGTGKTSLSAAIVRTLGKIRRKVVLLAPTGRAAKVFAMSSGHEAFTIHRRIYRQRTLDASGGVFNLNDNLHSDTLFMVDEASMIANLGSSGTSFGSGRLLDDLVRYVYSGRNCRLMLIGDAAQLPPVGEDESPALSADVLSGYGLKVYEATLDEVLRQASGSGILYNATVIRRLITRDQATLMPRVRFSGFADIQLVTGDELIDELAGSYSEVGEDETIVITRSNKRANIYNLGIRRTVLDMESELAGGDMIIIVKNNYFWPEKEKMDVSFLANGDRGRVVRARNERELYGFHFVDVTLRLPDYDDKELQATVIMEALTTDAPALSREQTEQLYNKVMEDYADVPLKVDRQRRLKADEYFNALQIKYAYAITCHKAQGGQWAHVYLDQGYMTTDMIDADYIHWLYTAFTRATEKLFLVNWPSQLTDEPSSET